YDPPFNAQGDERINLLGRSWYSMNSEEYDDYVDLWEIYLPHHRQVITLADDAMMGAYTGSVDYYEEALKEQKYVGPDRPLGPYHLLMGQRVPGNCMPKSEIQDLRDLHDMYNNIERKLFRQSKDYKQLFGILQGDVESGQRMKDANDGDFVQMVNPQATQ